jgi:hypothetical protein
VTNETGGLKGRKVGKGLREKSHGTQAMKVGAHTIKRAEMVIG